MLHGASQFHGLHLRLYREVRQQSQRAVLPFFLGNVVRTAVGAVYESAPSREAQQGDPLRMWRHLHNQVVRATPRRSHLIKFRGRAGDELVVGCGYVC